MPKYLHTVSQNLPDARTCPWCLRPLGFCWSIDRGGYVTHYNAECSSHTLAERASAAGITIAEALRIMRSVPVRV